MSLVIIIMTSFAYECKLTKTIDKINKFFERNPRINDDNLVAFNNMMKANSVPKTLRRQWQQFMLYREHPASYYMSFKHCVENPLRNSAYAQQMTVYKIISWVLVVLSFVAGVFMTMDAMSANVIFKDIFIIPITILVLYWLISMVLNLIHSAVSGDLFQNYQYFEINIDKAMLTLPEFVDYEVLFSQDEIRRGIPVLFAYLQKRAIQEQQELEKARLKSVDHEKFDFDKAGLDGSLVLDRAMRETENYTTQRKKYMQETERVNNEISVLENNYKEQTKEFQRQVQTSKETVENLKEQLEQATSTIEINYIKKQMRDEINRQQLAEKDFDILTDKHNQEIKKLNQEINHYEEETKKAKEAMEVAMLSEFNTYSIKVYDNLEKIVDEKMQERVDEYKDHIKNLEVEVEEKNEELENIYARYQEVLSQLPSEDEFEDDYIEDVPLKKDKKKKKSSKGEAPVDDGMVQPEQIDEYPQPQYDNYDSQQYYSEDYVNENQYNDQYSYEEQYQPIEEYSAEQENPVEYDEYNQYNDNYIPTEYEDSQYQDSYIPQDEQNFEGYVNSEQYNFDENAQTEEYIPLQDENYDSADTYIPLNDYNEESFAGEEYVPLTEEYVPQSEEYIPQDKEYVPQTEGCDMPEYTEEQPKDDGAEDEKITFDDTDFDVDFNKPSASEDFDNMDFDFDFGDRVEETAEQPVNVDVTEEDDDGDFDLNKVLGLYDNVSETKDKSVEKDEVDALWNVEKPKRKAGRPRKVVDETEEKPKRSVGRPRKVVTETEEKPKRKAGRPRKVVDETEEKPKRSVGRPRKDSVSTSSTPAKRRGRPRKEDVSKVVTETPKRGRPRKTIEEKANNTKRSVGRPRKDSVVKSSAAPKRGRPRKDTVKSAVSNKGVLGKPKRSVGRPRKNAN